MDLRRWCKILIAGVGKVPEVFPSTMVILQAEFGSVMRTCEGSVGEVGSSLFG